MARAFADWPPGPGSSKTDIRKRLVDALRQAHAPLMSTSRYLETSTDIDRGKDPVLSRCLDEVHDLLRISLGPSMPTRPRLRVCPREEHDAQGSLPVPVARGGLAGGVQRRCRRHSHPWSR